MAYNKVPFPNSFCTCCTPEFFLKKAQVLQFITVWGRRVLHAIPEPIALQQISPAPGRRNPSHKSAPHRASKGREEYVRLTNPKVADEWWWWAPQRVHAVFSLLLTKTLRLGGSGRRRPAVIIVILYAGKAASTPARRRKSAGAAQEKANPKSTLEKASFWKKRANSNLKRLGRIAF